MSSLRRSLVRGMEKKAITRERDGVHNRRDRRRKIKKNNQNAK